jgi:hypothetical protein
MSEQEIKQLFNIDIKERNRKFEYYIMRLLWSQQNKSQFKTVTALGQYLNLGHATILNMFLKQHKHANDPKFKILKEAFDKKDINILNKYYDLKNKPYYEQKIIFTENRTARYTDQVTRKHDNNDKGSAIICTPKDTMINVIDKLRTLKKNNRAYYLWNKPLPKWNIIDWDLYFNI